MKMSYKYDECDDCKKQAYVLIRKKEEYTTQFCYLCSSTYYKRKNARDISIDIKFIPIGLNLRDNGNLVIYFNGKIIKIQENETIIIDWREHIISSHVDIIESSTQKNSPANLIDLFIALVIKGYNPNVRMLQRNNQLAQIYKYFIIKVLYEYFVLLEQIYKTNATYIKALYMKGIPEYICHEICSYTETNEKLYKTYVKNLLNYGKISHFYTLKQLLFTKQDKYISFEDIKKELLTIVAIPLKITNLVWDIRYPIKNIYDYINK